MTVQRTLALVKSGARMRGEGDAILGRAEAAGLRVVAVRELPDAPVFWEEFYAEHVGKWHYERLVRSVTLPMPSLAAILEGEDAVHAWRSLLGPTDPKNAAPGTIRGDYGVELPDNAAHGSDSVFSAEREIALAFPELSP